MTAPAFDTLHALARLLPERVRVRADAGQRVFCTVKIGRSWVPFTIFSDEIFPTDAMLLEFALREECAARNLWPRLDIWPDGTGHVSLTDDCGCPSGKGEGDTPAEALARAVANALEGSECSRY